LDPGEIAPAPFDDEPAAQGRKSADGLQFEAEVGSGPIDLSDPMNRRAIDRGDLKEGG
jgi:hypothetical protein